MTRPRVGASLKCSSRLLSGRLGTSIALGAGIVLGLISVCCGTGVLMTPWLLCELNALQLAAAVGAPMVRSRSWIGAGTVLLGAVLLTASVAWLSWLGLGVRIETAGTSSLFVIGSAIVTLVFVLPFLYAPLILVERHGGLGGAALESARLVMAGGVLPHLLLSLTANAVQIGPLLIAASGAVIWVGADAAPLWALCSLPLLAVTVPLGQGMLVCAYVERRGEISDPRRTRIAGRPPVAVVAIWVAVVVAPALSFGLLGSSLVRPSRVPLGRLPPEGELLAEVARKDGSRSVYPPGTALEIVMDRSAVRVVASDGGGAGSLPLRGAGSPTAMRVARVKDAYAIEIAQGARVQTTWIDRAGVRLDDDFRARLNDRLPAHGLHVMLASLLLTACALLPVLGALGEVRRLYTLESGARPPPREVSRQRERTIRRAIVIALLLAPLSTVSLYWGALSVFG